MLNTPISKMYTRDYAKERINNNLGLVVFIIPILILAICSLPFSFMIPYSMFKEVLDPLMLNLLSLFCCLISIIAFVLIIIIGSLRFSHMRNIYDGKSGKQVFKEIIQINDKSLDVIYGRVAVMSKESYTWFHLISTDGLKFNVSKEMYAHVSKSDEVLIEYILLSQDYRYITKLSVTKSINQLQAPEVIEQQIKWEINQGYNKRLVFNIVTIVSILLISCVFFTVFVTVSRLITGAMN